MIETVHVYGPVQYLGRFLSNHSFLTGVLVSVVAALAAMQDRRSGYRAGSILWWSIALLVLISNVSYAVYSRWWPASAVGLVVLWAEVWVLKRYSLDGRS